MRTTVPAHAASVAYAAQVQLAPSAAGGNVDTNVAQESWLLLGFFKRELCPPPVLWPTSRWEAASVAAANGCVRNVGASPWPPLLLGFFKREFCPPPHVTARAEASPGAPLPTTTFLMRGMMSREKAALLCFWPL